jgi:hypothetical protein
MKTHEERKKEMEECRAYLEDCRGISESIKRCAAYRDMWFIVYKESPGEVAISFIPYCDNYGLYNYKPTKGFKWNRANYERVRQEITRVTEVPPEDCLEVVPPEDFI